MGNNINTKGAWEIVKCTRDCVHTTFNSLPNVGFVERITFLYSGVSLFMIMFSLLLGP